MFEPSDVWTDEQLDWSQKLDLTRPRELRASDGWLTIREGKARGPIVGGLRLPARPCEDPDRAVHRHDQVFRGDRPSQSAAQPIAEESLAMGPDGPGAWPESPAAQTLSTILPKCCEASIISWARRASASGSTSCTIGCSRPSKKNGAASSSSALLPM